MDVIRDNQKKENEVTLLANNFVHRSLGSNRDYKKKLFQKMSTSDYVAMWILYKSMQDGDVDSKIYLEDIAEKLKLPMGKVSKIVKELQDRGLVKWKHDGAGENGTYIVITENGISSAIEQQKILENFYKSIIEQYGEERFINLLGQIAELEEVMNRVIDEMGGN